MTVVTHKIAGIIYQTEWNSWLPVLEAYHFERFRVDNVPPDVHHYIHQVDQERLTMSPPSSNEIEYLSRFARWSKDLNSPLFRSPQVRARLHDYLDQPVHPDLVDLISTQDLVVIRDFARRQLDLFYTPEFGGFFEEDHRFLPQHSVTANFRQIFSTFLPSFSAFLIHSSGVIRNGAAALFLGPDGGGKTSIVTPLAEGSILSDDQIILRKEGDISVAHGTPLSTITSGPCQVQVGALFMLDRATHFELTSLEPVDVVQCLWTEHRNYTHFLPKPLKIRAFEILSEVCHQAPVYRMRFPKDYVDWDAIDAAMAR